jgi:dihydrofolate reductase
MIPLTIIAAVSENNVIGYEGKIPWKIPDDLRRFRKLTMGHPVIMGRKTYQSILDALGKPLDGRANIVMTRNKGNITDKRVAVCGSLTEAITNAELTSDKAFFIGGQMIYEMALPRVNKLEITRVKGSFEGDTYFPEWDLLEWREKNREDHPTHSFVTYVRK